MVKKRKTMICILLIAVTFFWCYLYSVSKKTKDGFFCTSDANFHTKNKTLSATINFHLQYGQGFLALNGDYLENGIKVSEVSLQKQFNYTERDGEYLFTQNNDGVLELSEMDRGILKDFIPEFYLARDEKIHHVRIKKLSNGLWIFTTAPVPYFVCSDY
ncbi:hypothetical protein V5K00_RS23005 [Enterobacter asburiae]